MESFNNHSFNSKILVFIIKSYGFNTELPWEIIEIYNGRSEFVDLIKSIVEEMKPISKVMKETQDTTKCALLTLKN